MAEKRIMASRLRELRRTAKLTQTEIAQKLNISQQAYAAYETARKEPKIDTLERLADIYKTSVDYLIGRY
jgi:transcriptional regulator with XRE-family HTH domain